MDKINTFEEFKIELQKIDKGFVTFILSEMLIKVRLGTHRTRYDYPNLRNYNELLKSVVEDFNYTWDLNLKQIN